MFFRHNSLVRRGPVTWTYSQDRIAKKKAPMNRSPKVLSKVDKAIWWRRLKMQAVKAGWAFTGGSSDL
jgi:hypothetical protein